MRIIDSEIENVLFKVIVNVRINRQMGGSVAKKLRSIWCLVAGQFGEGGVHFVGKALVSVLVDAQFV